MDQTIQTTRRHLLAQGGTAVVAGVALSGLLARAAAAQEATPAAAGTPFTVACDAAAEENLAIFHRLDFEAWNGRDWDLFSQIHAETVVVAGHGQQTEGIEDHLAWAQGFIAQFPDSMVVAHPIRIGAGDWTAVTGILDDGSTVATIARWENGQIAEEYLFDLDVGA
jgi:hypothetical protein